MIASEDAGIFRLSSGDTHLLRKWLLMLTQTWSCVTHVTILFFKIPHCLLIWICHFMSLFAVEDQEKSWSYTPQNIISLGAVIISRRLCHSWWCPHVKRSNHKLIWNLWGDPHVPLSNCCFWWPIWVGAAGNFLSSLIFNPSTTWYCTAVDYYYSWVPSLWNSLRAHVHQVLH